MLGILLIVIGAVVVGFGLILLAAATEKKRARPGASPSRMPALREFEQLCVTLAEKMRLDVADYELSENRCVDFVGINRTPITGGTYLVHGLLREPDEVVRSSEILEFSNMVVQERASKGIFITTGRFTPDLAALGELAPIEFIDGDRLESLVPYRTIRS